MSSSPTATGELTRLERLVGEVLGLRLLLTELLVDPTGEAGAGCARARDGALARLAAWEIGSDTPEGAQRIRSYVTQMLHDFPTPVPVVGPSAAPAS